MFEIERIKVPKRTTSDPWDNDSSAYSALMDMIIHQGGGDYKRIGSGAFGTVYGMDSSPIVYKFGDVDENKGYLSFVKELRKLKIDNPYFPKIHGMRIYECGRKDQWFVVAMERLEERSADLYPAIDTLEGLLREKAESRRINSTSVTGEQMLGIKVTRQVPPALTQAIDVLHRAYSRSGGEVDWDLHGGNFMWRKKQLVIIDPLA